MARRFFRDLCYGIILLALLLAGYCYYQLPQVNALPTLVRSGVSSHGASYVSLSQVPKVMQEAIIDTEDHSFYTNCGISFEGIGRSLLSDLKSGKFEEGASTLTQQLVRQHYLSSEKTISRKIKEVALALVVNKKYTKQEILEMYLNSIYFGHGAWGVQAAAQVYFKKNVSQLSPAQCTLLAGLPQAPSYLDPLSNYKAARDRQSQVLQSMVQAGDISQNDAAKILNVPPGIPLQNK
ncbi:MAG TPA: transglycosylase domain-containing protein [Syntrophomonadaceae bacterium]|nr:transglycosylase domain-containing protein [Syntrophomonadaceae bacterium]